MSRNIATAYLQLNNADVNEVFEAITNASLAHEMGLNWRETLNKRIKLSKGIKRQIYRELAKSSKATIDRIGFNLAEAISGNE